MVAAAGIIRSTSISRKVSRCSATARRSPTPPRNSSARTSGASGSVTFQVQFGEFGVSYVNHCHNTVHEDFALLARIQLLTGMNGSPQTAITDTPNPSRNGVTFSTPEILKEGDPRI